MLIELVEPLEVGQTIPVTLTFAKAGEIEVTATVRAVLEGASGGAWTLRSAAE